MDFKRTRPIQRGDIYYADLTPVTGSEEGGIRPVLILQNNVGNQHSPTVIAAAIKTASDFLSKLFFFFFFTSLKFFIKIPCPASTWRNIHIDILHGVN